MFILLRSHLSTYHLSSFSSDSSFVVISLLCIARLFTACDIVLVPFNHQHHAPDISLASSQTSVGYTLDGSGRNTPTVPSLVRLRNLLGKPYIQRHRYRLSRSLCRGSRDSLEMERTKRMKTAGRRRWQHVVVRGLACGIRV